MTPSAPPSTLPPLTREEAEHSARVEALIRRRIDAAGGWIDFETFMDLALYAPGLGYYRAGTAKLGSGGDFTTAPEMSDLFSRCVARQCAEVLAETGGDIVEFGAGTGRMAADILSALARLDALPERYCVVELSAELAARQQERIARLPRVLSERVVWLDRWPGETVRGVILANEVLDALPCQRFALRGGVAQALGVSVAKDVEPGEGGDLCENGGHHEGGAHRKDSGRLAGGTLCEVERPADPDLAAACEAVLRDLAAPLPDGYRSEINLRVEPWIRTVADGLGRGVVLLFDYGLPRAHYYHPQRTSGTLRCHFKHRAHGDPFIHAGMQDITAWVDFTRVAEGADSAGLDVLGFATQAAFLLGTGIEALAAEPTDPRERARVAGEARRLLLPGEMGESFKVMALGRGYDASLAGFAHQDLRASL
jgi:SAM-dependent MidA family methyltransferase